MDILSMTILDMQQAMEQGTLTSYELVLFYLDRIATIDQGDPKYNSVFTINPDALFIAQALDKERANGQVRSLMHGIPVLLKDNINTGDKQPTTAGANILKNHIAKKDAFITKTLRKQGAVILGKTNLTELACFKSFNTVNGFSSLGGYVLCPWNIKEDPSGSSTGSAVSVALQLTPVSIGTETGGSIMSPSMKNGVVGLKPTIGFVSRRGIVPISSTLDTAGPMGRTVSDVAVLLSAIRANDEQDTVTLTKKDEQIDYTKFLVKNAVQKMRIGIDKQGYDNLSPLRQKAFDTTCHILEQAGCIIVDNLDIMQTKRIYHVMKYEFKTLLNYYFKAEKLDLTLQDVVTYNQEHEKENLKYGQEVLLDVLHNTSGRMNEQEYIDALKERDVATKKLDSIFKEHQIDLIYFATYTSLGPHCGFPTLSLPIGLDEEQMPIGTYFLAPKWKEDTLLKVAYVVEQANQLKLNPLQEKN